MRSLFIALFLIFSSSSFAKTVNVQIQDLDMGESTLDQVLVFLSNGLVAKLLSPDGLLIDSLLDARDSKAWLSLELNDAREILSIEEGMAPAEPKSLPLSFASQDYVPTVIGSMMEAQTIFQDARKTTKENQCFNRAHVWAYEWRLKYELFSSKAWLFFTRKYIRRYDFEWWFHIAPMFHVMENGQVKERVADVKYARGPISLKQWTDIFLRNDADCRVVHNYSDQANYQESAWCYTMKSSMYYYVPLDLEQFEKTGATKDAWLENEVLEAYREAFNLQ